MTTPNMGLTQNVIGVTTDPTWSNNITGDFNIIDAHNHVPISTPGGLGGSQITQLGINITGMMSFNSQDITAINSWSLVNQTGTLANTYQNAGYFVNGNFYINNATGTPVQITNGNSINISGSGGIGGQYASSGALVSYATVNSTYTFLTPTSTSAAIYAGPLSTNFPGSAFATTISNPSGATGNVTITSFPAQPAAGAILTDGSGQLSTLPLSSGMYTPTIVGVSGFTNGTISVRQHNYSRVGSIVTVSGFVNFTGGTSSSTSSFTISLPVSTANFSSVYQGTGVCSYQTGSGNPLSGSIQSNIGATTVTATVSTVSATTGSAVLYTFTYQIQ